jgi:hypothetical protein
VADLACGTGWAGIELAKAFPHIRVNGLDSDEASIAVGRRHAVEHGVADRVDLEVADLADAAADWSQRYDLVLLIECVHDLPRPVEALRHARAAIRPGGTVLVVDERAAETFTAPGDEMERFFAAASAIWCLPQGRVGPDPEPVGTLIRPAVMRDLARRGGLRRYRDPADRASGLALLPAGPVTMLDGRVAIVTGTSSGLGRRFAEVLDGAGARVVLASRRHQADLELAGRLRDALPVCCDVRSSADREALVRTVTGRFGRIDILVNNAGVAYSGPAEEESQEHLRDLIDTNLTAVFGLAQLAGRHMLAQGSGVIVNIASASAIVSLDRYGLAGYGATKAGVVALTRELAYQWGGRGVRVNALAPSFFPSATTGWLSDPDQVAWISANAPLGRPPRPEELDGPLLFLASDASSYVTGQTLYVDGGWTCR